MVYYPVGDTGRAFLCSTFTFKDTFAFSFSCLMDYAMRILFLKQNFSINNRGNDCIVFGEAQFLISSKFPPQNADDCLAFEIIYTMEEAFTTNGCIANTMDQIVERKKNYLH